MATGPKFGMYDCIIKPCPHATDAPPAECARNAISHVISRRGDPSLMAETRLVAKLFRVKLLQSVFTYKVIDTPSKDPKASMKEYLDNLGLGNAAEENSDFFEKMTDEVSAAMLILFECFLRSMGLRFDDANDRRLIVSDDPAIDYGYGAGAAVILRREGWGKIIGQKELCDPGTPQLLSTINIIFSVASIGRSDLAIELFSRLMTEKYAISPVDDLGPIDPRNNTTDGIRALCTHCLIMPTSPVLPRAMLSIRPLLESAAKRPLLESTAVCPGGVTEECKCGFSKLVFRLRNDFRGDGEITEIAACPSTLLLGKMGCRKWTIAN